MTGPGAASAYAAPRPCRHPPRLVVISPGLVVASPEFSRRSRPLGDDQSVGAYSESGFSVRGFSDFGVSVRSGRGVALSACGEAGFSLDAGFAARAAPESADRPSSRGFCVAASADPVFALAGSAEVFSVAVFSPAGAVEFEVRDAGASSRLSSPPRAAR